MLITALGFSGQITTGTVPGGGKHPHGSLPRWVSQGDQMVHRLSKRTVVAGLALVLWHLPRSPPSSPMELSETPCHTSNAIVSGTKAHQHGSGLLFGRTGSDVGRGAGKGCTGNAQSPWTAFPQTLRSSERVTTITSLLNVSFAINLTNVTYLETSAPMHTTTPSPVATYLTVSCPQSSASGLKCSGQGVCMGSGCICNEGFSGSDCAQQIQMASTPSPVKVSVTIEVTLPMSKTAFFKVDDDFIRSVATAAHTMASDVTVLSVRTGEMRSNPLIRRGLLAARDTIFVKTQILTGSQEADFITKESLDAQLIAHGLPTSIAFQKTVRDVKIESTTPSEGWISQGANLFVVVAAAGGFFVCVFGFGLKYRKFLLDIMKGPSRASHHQDEFSFENSLGKRKNKVVPGPTEVVEIEYEKRPLTADSVVDLPDGRTISRDPHPHKALEQYRDAATVCWCRPSSVAVLPCMHICLCDLCQVERCCPMCSTEAVGLLKFKKARPPKSPPRKAAVLMRSETAREGEGAKRVRDRKGANEVQERKGSEEVGSEDLPAKEHRGKPVLKHLTFEATPGFDAASASQDTSEIRPAAVGGDRQLLVSAPQEAALDRQPWAASETPVPEPPPDVRCASLPAPVTVPARILAPSLVRKGRQTAKSTAAGGNVGGCAGYQEPGEETLHSANLQTSLRSQESTRLQAAGDTSGHEEIARARISSTDRADTDGVEMSAASGNCGRGVVFGAAGHLIRATSVGTTKISSIEALELLERQ